MTHKTIFRGSTAAWIIAASALFAANPVFAQSAPVQADADPQSGTTADSTILDESAGPTLGDAIVVTARRREENMLTVPIAVSVMGSAAIEATGVNDLSEVAQFTPGLFIKPQGSGSTVDRSQARLVFRGLSTSEGPIFIDGATSRATVRPM